MTFGFLVSGKFSLIRALLYILSQVAGAGCGALFLQLATPPKSPIAPKTPVPAASVPGNVTGDGTGESLGVCEEEEVFGLKEAVQGIALSAVIAALLVFTVFSSVDNANRNDQYGCSALMIGLSIAAGQLLAVLN